MKSTISPLSQAEKTKLYTSFKTNPAMAMVHILEYVRNESEGQLVNIQAQIVENLRKELTDLGIILQKVKGEDGKDSKAEEVADILLRNRDFIDMVSGEDGAPGENVDIDKVVVEVCKTMMADMHFMEMVKGEKGDSPTAQEIAREILSNKTFLKHVTPNKISAKDVAYTLVADPAFIKKVTPEAKDGSPDTPDQIAGKLNTLKAAVDQDVIKGLPEIIKKLFDLLREKRRGGGGKGSGGMGNVVPETFSVSSATTSITLANGVASNGRAIWLNYQGQQQAYGTHFTVLNNVVTLLFTPDDSTFIDVIYIRS